MPYAQTNLKDEELKKQQVAGSAPNISGTSNSFATGVPGQEPSKKSSGQYANIQSYVDANKDQAGEMGKNIASNVEQKGQDAQTRVDNLSKSVSKIGAYDPNSVIGKITGYNQNPWDPNSGPERPEITNEEKKQYQTMKQTGGYTGPSDISGISGYQDTQTKAIAAAQAAKGASTEQGQQALLKETYAKPSYTAGQNKLDQVLLGGSQDGKQAIQSAANKYSGLEDLFKDTSTQLGNTINENINTALLNKEAFNPLETQAKSALLGEIQKQAMEQTAQNKSLADRALASLNNNTSIDDDILQRIGLRTGQNIYDLNLKDYLTTDYTPSDLNNAATNDQRIKYQQLADLFGDQSMNAIDNTGKPINAISFDNEKLLKDLPGARTAYQQSNQQYNGVVKNIVPSGVLNGTDFSPQYLETVQIPLMEQDVAGYRALGNQKTADLIQSRLDAVRNSLASWHQKNDRIIKTSGGYSTPITGGVKSGQGLGGDTWQG